MAEDTKHFWTSLPGILTGIAAVVTSVTGLLVAFNGTAAKTSDHKPADVVAVSAPATSPVATTSVVTTHAASTSAATVPTAAQEDLYTRAAVIVDKDGFTNVRAARSPQSDVLAVVNRDEQFFTYPQDTKWWRVKTREGVMGYMHESRIKLLDAQ